ncbi:Mannose-binding lectin [Phytophthora cinnamomi]|uniref:Mannose-binding lectin n=1 Tax=Phytophthora cinnamomi TaxID=4785 RepID=UPI00355A1D73|nr:Mannose-binding lectin [Phytophthora cinnamomi]
MPRLAVPQVLVFLLLVVCYGPRTIVDADKTDGTTTDEDIVLSEIYGGPHGYAFSDMSSITLGRTLSSVTVRGALRIDAISAQASKPAGSNWDHGGSGGKEHVLVLGDGEYVNSMEIHWTKKGTHTRVFYLKLASNKGNYVSAGTKTANRATVKAPKGFQLSGFYGRAASEVDQLGAIWTRRSAKPALLTDRMGTGWYGKRIRNWVGPTIGANSDTACYRQTQHFNSSKVCPSGYTKTGDYCIAQCPMAYPVECYLECIPQNDDCALEIIQKTVAVVAAVFNVATAGIFGAIFSTFKHPRRYFFCGANVVGVIRSLVYYIRFQQTTAPQGAVEEILAAAYQTDVVTVDLPVAICHCLGIHVPPSLQFTGIVMMIVENIVKQVIINGDEILSSAQNVYTLLNNASLVNSSHTSVDALGELMKTNSTCGYQLKRLSDHVAFSVVGIRNTTPGANINDIRVQISNSRLVQKDIPAATNNCMNELLSYKTKQAAFETRDLLRKTFGVIVEQLITTATTNMGKFVAMEQYLLEVTNLGLTVFAGLDPTRIVWLASQFVQPTCGPTSFIGEIDDGSLYDALGLTTVDEAFVGSYGAWKNKGDGIVRIFFKSIDTKDVTVVIYSGGEKVTKVDVDAGETVTWNSTILKLQDKVLYLDRWRPDLIGLPGSGGGSLKLWVPRSSSGGHLTMHVMINVS